MSDSSQNGTDVVVVGGGAVGCAIALWLARAGVAVTLIERDRPGAGASSAAAGILVPEAGPDVPPALLALWQRGQALFPDLIDYLHEDAGFPVEYRVAGRLVLALDETRFAELREHAALQQAAGIRVELLDGNAVREAEPAIAAKVTGAIYFPDHALLDNGRLSAALAAAAVRAGARVQASRAVAGLVLEDGTVRGVRLGGSAGTEVLACRTVVNAAGSWAGQLDPRAALPVAPVKGQMLSLLTWPPLLRHIVSAPGVSLIPRADGRLLCGATVEDAGYDTRVTAGAAAQFLGAALTLVPPLRDCPLESTWAGLRPRCTVDGLLIIGADPRWEGLYHATGHFKMGIISAPSTAEAIAHLIAGTSCDLDLTPFAPDRCLASPSSTPGLTNRPADLPA
ncbi:MAG: glycine oxidase ThiO [Chloroflexi bacterium]|nr:glycine oxidase ThiO [Chloroflexota bacterium]